MPEDCKKIGPLNKLESYRYMYIFLVSILSLIFEKLPEMGYIILERNMSKFQTGGPKVKMLLTINLC